MTQIVSSTALTRREALRRGGLALAFATQAVGCGDEPVAVGKSIVDCHIHLWAADRERFPFHPRAPYIPEIVSTVEQWETDRQGTGITTGIFVSGSPYLEDHRYLLHCLSVAPQSLVGVARFDPLRDGNLEQLEDLSRQATIVGARIHSTGGEVPYWRTAKLEALWDKVGAMDKVLQIHMHPRWSRELERMVYKYPGTRVVIDHLGRPTSGDPVDYEITLGLAEYPHVYMKTSAFNEHSRQEHPFDDLIPLLERVAERFTPRRMAYRSLWELADHLHSFLSPEDRHQIFTETPKRLYKL